MQPKQRISASLRQSVWLAWIGKEYDAKCTIKWCQSRITPFSFEVGHNIPESRGGATTLDNLRPICGICNKSMGNRYTIEEYSRLHQTKQNCYKKCVSSVFTCCYSAPVINEQSAA